MNMNDYCEYSCGFHRGPHWLYQDYLDRRGHLEALTCLVDTLEQEREVKRSEAYQTWSEYQRWQYYLQMSGLIIGDVCQYRLEEEVRKYELMCVQKVDHSPTDHDYACLGLDLDALDEREDLLLQRIEKLYGSRYALVLLIDHQHETYVQDLRNRRRYSPFPLTPQEEAEEQYILAYKAAQQKQSTCKRERGLLPAIVQQSAQPVCLQPSATMQLALFDLQLPVHINEQHRLLQHHEYKHGSVAVPYPIGGQPAWLVTFCYGMFLMTESELHAEQVVDGEQGKEYILNWEFYLCLPRLALQRDPALYLAEGYKFCRFTSPTQDVYLQDHFVQDHFVSFSSTATYWYVSQKHMILVEQEETIVACYMEFQPRITPCRKGADV